MSQKGRNYKIKSNFEFIQQFANYVMICQAKSTHEFKLRYCVLHDKILLMHGKIIYVI